MKVYSLALLLLLLVQQKVQTTKNSPANIVFKSIDGGKTWQDISEGLPENLREDVIQRDAFFANDSGLYLRVGKSLYRSEQNSTAPFWQKESYSDKHNAEKTWKQVHTRVMKVVESNGVLMATSRDGILRSTDDGENWEIVLREGGIGIDIERIEGGFAAINYNTTSNTRRVRASYDSGATWQPIDAGLSPTPFIASIIQVDKYFFCGHPAGIFRSSDKGKTWQLILPSIENKVLNLTVSGNVIYAIARIAGC